MYYLNDQAYFDKLDDSDAFYEAVEEKLETVLDDMMVQSEQIEKNGFDPDIDKVIQDFFEMDDEATLERQAKTMLKLWAAFKDAETTRKERREAKKEELSKAIANAAYEFYRCLDIHAMRVAEKIAESEVKGEADDSWLDWKLEQITDKRRKERRQECGQFSPWNYGGESPA